jgi:hypothetical protein
MGFFCQRGEYFGLAFRYFTFWRGEKSYNREMSFLKGSSMIGESFSRRDETDGLLRRGTVGWLPNQK